VSDRRGEAGGPRIAIIHAVPGAIDPIGAAFAALWPEARTDNLLEDSLSTDIAEAGAETAAIQERIADLAAYVTKAGADAILYSCSAFGTSIDRVKRSSSLPVLKPNEAMIEEALELGPRVGLVATFAPTLESMRPEFNALARQRGIDLRLEERLVPGAMAALNGGEAERHDALIAAAAGTLGGCDSIVLAQFTMARARPTVETAVAAPVLTSPESAVARLKNLWQTENATGNE
jgi:aspartate/glutamate racemase